MWKNKNNKYLKENKEKERKKKTKETSHEVSTSLMIILANIHKEF